MKKFWLILISVSLSSCVSYQARLSVTRPVAPKRPEHLFSLEDGRYVIERARAQELLGYFRAVENYEKQVILALDYYEGEDAKRYRTHSSK